MGTGGKAGCHSILIPVSGDRAASGTDSSTFLTAEVRPVHSLGGAVAIHVPISAIAPTLLRRGWRIGLSQIAEALPGATAHTTATVFVTLPEGGLAGRLAGPATAGEVIVTPGQTLPLGSNDDVQVR